MHASRYISAIASGFHPALARFSYLLRSPSVKKSSLVVLLAWCSVGRAQEPPVATVREGAMRDLELLVKTVQDSWAYVEDKRTNFGVDLERLKSLAATEIQSCSNKSEAFDALRGVVVGLKDGHASLRVPEPHGGSGAGRLPGRWFDTQEGIVYGKQLVAGWNGGSVQDVLASLAPKVYASTPGMARHLALQKLPYGTLNGTVHLKLRQINGVEEEKAFRYEPDSAAEPPPIELRWPEPDIAHLALRTFDVHHAGWGANQGGAKNASGLPVAAVAEVQERISQAFAQCAAAQALILDLRGNGGGSDSIGSHVALHLVPGQFCYFKLQTRYSPELKRLPGFESAPDTGWSVSNEGWKPPRPATVRAFDGLIWVLLDEGCFSTTDNLLACLRDLLPQARARFIGRPSGGGTGAPRPLVTLPFTGAQLTITVMQVRSPNGNLIEGRGTVPDRRIAWSWNDVLRDGDPDLEAALAEARARLREPRAGSSKP